MVLLEVNNKEGYEVENGPQIMQIILNTFCSHDGVSKPVNENDWKNACLMSQFELTEFTTVDGNKFNLYA